MSAVYICFIESIKLEEKTFTISGRSLRALKMLRLKVKKVMLPLQAM